VNLKDILIGFLFNLVGHTLTFYQLNGQFIWEYFKRNPLVITLIGLPISYTFIYATKYTIGGFGGIMWPSRFMGFAAGMLVYAFFTYWQFGESINTKTFISLLLCVFLILIQVFWK
jgi:hypothetical protein